MLKEIYQYILIQRSGLFDRAYYLHHYPDVRIADIDALMHFIKMGWKEYRNPSEAFNTRYYLAQNSDVENANINPLVHYIKHGQKEGRSTFEKRKQYQSNRKKTIRFLNLDPTIDIDKNIEIIGKIAVHIHIYYENLIDEFASYLKQMPLYYDLFISVTNDNALAICEEKFSDLPFLLKLDIKQVPNRGRDMAPFFCTFGDQLKYYQYIAHLHSKQSLYNQGATQGWREYLCSSLFESPDSINTIIRLLQEENRVGLVYPQTFHRVPYMAHTWLANKRLGRIWCERLGINNLPKGYFDFPVGSMFWARGDALAPLFEAGIQLEDFEIEKGQTDGTFAHALERLIGIVSKKKGFDHGIITDQENPGWSAWRFEQYFSKSFAHMIKRFQSQEIKVIGFDIFDTLLIRPLLDPETIKKIIAINVGGDLGKQYLELRPLAEMQARQEKKADVNLDEIYQQMAKLSDITEEDLDKLRAYEETIEEASIHPRPEAINLYREAVATGKPVALVSDTFLRKEFLAYILNKHGINEFDQLFASSDIGFRKDGGKLYDYVLQTYSLKPEAFLMIGDNERSDFQIPTDKDIQNIHLLKPVEIARGLPRFSNLINNFEQSNSIDEEISLGMVIQKNFAPITFQDFNPDWLIKLDPYDIGFNLVGPLLTSFAQWLLIKSKEEDIDHLFFLSREGKIIKKIFDVWTEDVEEAPLSVYWEISRRAISMASVKNLNDILKIASTAYHGNKLEKFLKTRYGIQLSLEKWAEINRRFNLSADSTIVVTNKDIEHLVPLLTFIEGDIISNAKQELPGFLHYLEKNHFSDKAKSAVVDIGFGGTIQGYLNKLLNSKIHGYYLMTENRSREIAENYQVQICGCFAQNVDPEGDPPVMFKRSFILEKLLGCNDPQILFYEFLDDGSITKVYRDLKPEEKSSFDIRNQIHAGAQEYALEASKIRKQIYPEFKPSPDVAKSLAAQFLDHLTSDDFAFLSKIVSDDYYCGRDLVM
jgi:predicted HAD superfamily hydrolase